MSSTWTVPSVSNCSSAIYSQGILFAFDPYYGANIEHDLSCLPAAATLWWWQDNTAATATTTALGPLACPEMYTTATTSKVNEQTTYLACCPSEYTYQHTLLGVATVGECNSLLTAGQVVTYQAPIGTGGATWSNWSTASTTEVASDAHTAYGIHINGFIFAESTTSSSDPTAASTGTFTSATATSSPATSSAVSSTSGSLSTGAKAGVGIGAALAGIGLICALVTFCLFHSQRKRAWHNQDHTQNPELGPAMQRQEVEVNNNSFRGQVERIHEANGTDSSVYVPEMNGSGVGDDVNRTFVHELPTEQVEFLAR